MYSVFPNMSPFLAPQNGESKSAQGFPAAETKPEPVQAFAQQLSDPLRQQSYRGEKAPWFLSLKNKQQHIWDLKIPWSGMKGGCAAPLPSYPIYQAQPRNE